MNEDRVKDVWGARTPHGVNGQWPIRVDQHLLPGVDETAVTWHQSACVLCSNGCGIDIGVVAGQMVGVRGRAEDRVNHGRLGPKGSYGWQANSSPDRLTSPLIRRDGELQQATWDEAMDLVVQRSRDVLGRLGPIGLGFYTSGQLFLEDYYTLGVLVRGGIGTPHLDGNTRLCTATSDFALKESFGSDGAPGSLTDFDVCDTILAVGHNIPETHTVLWSRILDRLEGGDPPRLVVVDPRRTRIAEKATVHLPIRPGTNVALLNGLQHELLQRGYVDDAFVSAHTVGYERLEKLLKQYSPELVSTLCGVPAADISAATEVIGEAHRLVSTCLQGVYQSHQATAAACQLNNITLLRGMIGRPGCTVFQMNGQPTAQNTRETGADGDFVGMRNWQNPDHVAQLASLWNVEPSQIPSWAPPTHAMQIFRHAEEGSVQFLWVSGTNPAVSLPELHRIRSILGQDRLFLVVSDAFPTETTQLADVVLPAALWGEKLGTFTNHDRTVHLSEKAVEPPGQARPDFEIFLDYADRLGLKDKDGEPLLKWRTPQACFDAFKEVTRGRPCDYSGLTYEALRGSPGIQWPVTADQPSGTERLYTDHHFHTETDYTEDYGHDLSTGAAHERKDHLAMGANGRAILHAVEYEPAHEQPSDQRPLLFTSGRTVYHFHTRTKTGRAPELEMAAPGPWVELSASDAAKHDIEDGDLVRVESARGHIEVPARIRGNREGVVFAPFHFGYWDSSASLDGTTPGDRPTAANELTMTEWDPVSKQPVLKLAAVSIAKVTP